MDYDPGFDGYHLRLGYIKIKAIQNIIILGGFNF